MVKTKEFRRYWTTDRKFGLKISEGKVEKIFKICRKSGGLETGGMIVGFYNSEQDCAIVKNISGPPPDSRFDETFFYRGKQGLQQWFIKLWRKRKREFLLGEWHFHPGGMALPSSIDISQMETNSFCDNYQCSEPILILVGGNPKTKHEFRVLIFPKGKVYEEMRQNAENQK